MSRLYFKGTRKPKYKNIKDKDIYNLYWQEKGFVMRDKLMERERIFFKWIKPGTKVLSIGCGNSRLLYELKNRKNCDVYGIDIEPLVIQGLKENNIDAKVADVARDDFDLRNYYDFKFDYIILSEFLEHLALPEVLVNKLKPYTHYFVISTPNSAFYRYRLGLMFNGRFFTQWAQHQAEHLRFWSQTDFIDWLKAMGLRLIKTKPSNGPFLKDAWPNMFGHQICYLVS